VEEMSLEETRQREKETSQEYTHHDKTVVLLSQSTNHHSSTQQQQQQQPSLSSPRHHHLSQVFSRVFERRFLFVVASPNRHPGVSQHLRRRGAHGWVFVQELLQQVNGFH
jgi:hypothetical protein